MTRDNNECIIIIKRVQVRRGGSARGITQGYTCPPCSLLQGVQDSRASHSACGHAYPERTIHESPVRSEVAVPTGVQPEGWQTVNNLVRSARSITV